MKRTFALLVLLVLGFLPASPSAALWIETVSDSGAVIVLSDDSTWEVDFRDQARAALWLPLQRVTLAKGERQSEYLIIRITRRDSVRVAFVR